MSPRTPGDPGRSRERAAPTRPLDAAVFDLDGVVTHTAELHFSSWKALFDAFLRRRAGAPGEDLSPLTRADYLAWVDGRPRLDGIRWFLTARGIDLPEGSPADPPDAETVHGLARRKNALFLEHLARRGARVDVHVVALVRALDADGVRVGVASSSRNAAAVLDRAGLGDLFDARVDGTTLAELGLPGKPHPDLFLECARRLGAPSPAGALVMEDAAAGVEAAVHGGFGLIIAIDRGGNRDRLSRAGADWIVSDTRGLTLDHIRAAWTLRHRESTSHRPPPAP